MRGVRSDLDWRSECGTMRPRWLSCGPLQREGTMRHNSSREHSTEGQMGHMTVFLSACPSDCLWVGTLTSLCDDVLRRITSRRERERIVPWRKPVSADWSASGKISESVKQRTRQPRQGEQSYQRLTKHSPSASEPAGLLKCLRTWLVCTVDNRFEAQTAKIPSQPTV